MIPQSLISNIFHSAHISGISKLFLLNRQLRGEKYLFIIGLQELCTRSLNFYTKRSFRFLQPNLSTWLASAR